MTVLALLLVWSGMAVIIFLAAKDTFVEHTVTPGVFFQFIILAVLKYTIGIRVSEEVEEEGLDINLHGEVVHG